MKALGTGETTSLVVARFPRDVHERLRRASVEHGKSIKTIVIEAIELWIEAPDEEE